MFKKQFQLKIEMAVVSCMFRGWDPLEFSALSRTTVSTKSLMYPVALLKKLTKHKDDEKTLSPKP